MVTSIYTAILLAQAAMGGHGHHAPRGGCCGDCGVATAKVFAEVARLRTCPRWRDRDDAAEELRDFDWRCHPEVVEALAAAMLHDREEEVREEAAESLAKMRPCLPVAHQALRLAANCDPDHATRKWARRGLAAINGRCEGACQVCGPAPAGVVIPGPVVEPPLAPSGWPGPPTILSPRIEVHPGAVPPDLPPTIPGTSPFSSAPPEPALPMGRPGSMPGRPDLAPVLMSQPVPSDPNRPPY